MPLIRPFSDLRNHINDISALCHQSGQPVFITKNGAGSLVVMSHAAYEQLEARFDFYAKLDEAADSHLRAPGPARP